MTGVQTCALPICDIELSRVIVVFYVCIEINTEILTWIIAILNFSTEISDIELCEIIVVLKSIMKYITESVDRGVVFTTEISIEILKWIVRGPNFSTKTGDIELSRLIVVPFLFTEVVLKY